MVASFFTRYSIKRVTFFWDKDSQSMNTGMNTGQKKYRWKAKAIFWTTAWNANV